MPAVAEASARAQVVHVCAEHKKLAKLLKHLRAVNAERAGSRQLPLVLIFANRIKVRRPPPMPPARPCACDCWQRCS